MKRCDKALRKAYRKGRKEGFDHGFNTARMVYEEMAVQQQREIERLNSEIILGEEGNDGEEEDTDN